MQLGSTSDNSSSVTDLTGMCVCTRRQLVEKRKPSTATNANWKKVTMLPDPLSSLGYKRQY